MKTRHVVLFVVLLIGGSWAISVYMNRPSPTPKKPVTSIETTAADRTAEPEASSEPVLTTDPPALIGTLRSRRHTIHLYPGKFTVEDSDGKVLANLVTKEAFAELLPDVFAEFQHWYADSRILADNHTRASLPAGWSYSTTSAGEKTITLRSDP